MRRLFVVCAAASVAMSTALPAQAAPAGGLQRVIVQLHDGAGAPTAVAQEVVGRYLGRPIAVYEHAIQGFALELPTGAVAALARDPRVADITFDRIMTVAAETTPTGFDRAEADLVPWGDVTTTATHCPTGSDCADVDIAILDTGIELYHQDLNVYRATNCTWNLLFASCANVGDLYDRNGHGTHVAGTAAACDNDIGVRGVAACARLWSFKVLSDSGSGYLSWIIAGVDTVTAYAGEIEVANMSLTGQFQNSVLNTALSNSVAAGVVYVVAAGNSSADAASFSPASHDDMITVSAAADFDGMGGGAGNNSCRPQDNDDVFALSFSNYGADVDLAAPGVCIYSTHLNDGYATYTGTSMAAPHVAGAAALYIAKQGRDRNGDSVVDGTDVALVRSALVSAGLPQGNACSFSGDPDSYPEPLLFVNGSAFGGNGTCTMSGSPPPVNNPPSAADDSYTTDEDTALNVAAPGVLTNDNDPDLDPLTAVLEVGPSNAASFTLNPDGSFNYTPAADYNGADSFTYHANDGVDDSGTVTVNLTVSPVNDPPAAVGESYTLDQDTTLNVAAPGVLANDSDGGDGGALSAVLDTPPSNAASFTLNSDGSFTYTPTSGYSGGDSFTYHADDGDPSNTVTVNLTINPTAPTTAPKLANGLVTGVLSSGWTTVTPGETYSSMVVVATPSYDSSSVPVVVRVRNVTATTFEVSLARTAGTGVVSADVYWLTVEEGVYTEAEHGVKMEAHTFLSTVTDENNSWNGEVRPYSNSYSTPVVLGQVMTTNDADWSVFWSSGSSRNRAPNGTLRVGKHVGEDPDTTRTNEVIGYIVIEAGSGLIDGRSYLAAVGADSIRGVGNSPPYSYSFSGISATGAVASQTGMDGNNGGWALFYGNNPVTSGALSLAVDEDQSADSERSHTSEQVAYIVFG